MNSERPGLAYPRLCGLIGTAPSRLSQAMHNAGFKARGLPFFYVAFDTGDTETALRAMRTLGFRGLSATIPHKEKAALLVDDLTKEAKAIGAVNTIINDGTRLSGHNTDCFGIMEALREAAFKVEGRRVLILGAGGASRAAIYSCKELKAKIIYVANRSDTRAKNLAKEWQVETRPYSITQSGVLEGIDLLINATPLGSHPVYGSVDSYPFDFSEITSKLCVFDFVTQETHLTQAAEKRGCKVIYGKRMLLHQALKQFTLFTEEEAPIDVMEAALNL